MIKDFKRIAGQADAIVADAIGAVALMVILVTGLYLPLVL